jgi:L-amino acid N-acyltransferase YncA
MGIRVRRAIIEDSEDIASMMLEFEDFMEETNPQVWRLTEFGRKDIMKRVETLLSLMRYTIVSEEEELTGFASAHVIRRSEFAPGTVGFVDMLYVKVPHRRKGTALRLLGDIGDYFGREKVTEVNLRYVVGNLAADTLWHELGFKPVLITVNTSLNTFRDALRKKLVYNDGSDGIS